MDGPGALPTCGALQLSADGVSCHLLFFLILKIASPNTVIETEN